MEEKGDTCRAVDGKREGEGPPGRPGHRWEKILKRVFKKQDGEV
jgi:hypothetical protein